MQTTETTENLIMPLNDRLSRWAETLWTEEDESPLDAIQVKMLLQILL